MTIRAVLFDLFDTLVDLRLEDLEPVRVGGQLVSPTAPELHAQVAARHDVPFDVFLATMRRVDREFRDTRYREGREVGTLERFERLVGELGLADGELPGLLTGTHMGRLRAQVREVPHHREVLRALRERVAVGLCSNFTHAETAVAILEEAGLRAHLDAEAISETVGWRKPRPEIFEAVLAALGVAPHEVLHVGDNLDADVAGAAALGIHTAWLTRRVPNPAKALAHHKGPPPTHTLQDLSDMTSGTVLLP